MPEDDGSEVLLREGGCIGTKGRNSFQGSRIMVMIIHVIKPSKTTDALWNKPMLSWLCERASQIARRMYKFCSPAVLKEPET